MPKKRDGTVKVDFTGVSTEGGGRLLPEDTYKFEVKEVTQETSDKSGEDYLAFTFEVVDGEFEGTKAWDNMSLQPQALWKLRSFMEAAGEETEDGEMEIDPQDFVGLVVQANVIHEPYKGKEKHRIDTYSPAEDDTPAKGSSKKRPSKNEEPEDETTPQWKVNQKVSFKDGKKTLTGKVKEIDGDQVTVLVKGVSKDADGEYEMSASELEAA